MKILRYILLPFIALAISASAGEIARKADAAYLSDNFADAIALYQQAIDSEGVSPTLWYNLGNAFYRNGNIAQAIVSYNRALRLDPNFDDARANLEFVNEKLIDKAPDEASLTEKFADKIVTMTTANAWAVIALVLFALTLAAIAGYIFSPYVTARKVSFFGGIILLAATIGATITAFAAASRQTSRSQAVVTVESVQLGTSPRTPRNKAEEAYLIHEGTMVEIIDSVRPSADADNPLWFEVKLPDNGRAWIAAGQVEII